MKAWGLVAVVLVLGACGAKAESGGTAATTPGTAVEPGAGAPDSTEAPPVDAKLPELFSPALVWHFPAPTVGDEAGALAAAGADALTQVLGGPVAMAGDPTQSWTFTAATTNEAASGAADARAMADGIWQASGLDLSTADVSVSPDGTTLTAVERLDGVPSPLPFVVVVGADGAVVSASGHLVSPTAVGRQARLGTAAAMSLLTSAPGDDRGEQQPSLAPDPTPAVPPLGPQPTTEPAPSVVDRVLLPVTGVAETYIVTPAADGGVWLLPGYRFTFDDGSSRSVLAVAGPPQVDAAAGAPTSCAAGTPDCAIEEFVGLPEDEAAARAAAQGRAFRVAERDGVEQMLTADYNPDRVNVAVTAGIVTRASLG